MEKVQLQLIIDKLAKFGKQPQPRPLGYSSSRPNKRALTKRHSKKSASLAVPDAGSLRTP